MYIIKQSTDFIGCPSQDDLEPAFATRKTQSFHSVRSSGVDLTYSRLPSPMDSLHDLQNA